MVLLHTVNLHSGLPLTLWLYINRDIKSKIRPILLGVANAPDLYSADMPLRQDIRHSIEMLLDIKNFFMYKYSLAFTLTVAGGSLYCLFAEYQPTEALNLF